MPRGAHSSAIHTWRGDGAGGRVLSVETGGRIRARTTISCALLAETANVKAPVKNKILMLVFIVIIFGFI